MSHMSRSILLPVTAAISLGAAACSTPPPPPPDDVTDAPEPTRKRIVPTIESEVGALDSAKVQAVFDAASGALKECYERGVGRIGFLAGEIKLSVRVGEDGATKYTFVKESTLGDRQTEACMLGVLKKQRWPKPEGGKEGNADTSFTFDPGDEERPPVEWTEARMGDGLKKARGALAQCRQGAGAGPMKVTLYVETDGKAMGVGVSGADSKSEDAASCVVDLLMGVKFASPGSYAAKVTLSID
jgi:hypothetical protein